MGIEPRTQQIPNCLPPQPNYVTANCTKRHLPRRFSRLRNISATVTEFWLCSRTHNLKGYSLDGKWLRDGSANWSPGSEKRQDNSVWFSSDPQQIAAYERKFDEMWSRTSNLVVQ